MAFLQQQEETLEPAELAALQRERLAAMLQEILSGNLFYQRKLQDLWTHEPIDLARLPFTTRQELWKDQAANPPYGANLTYPRGRYVRVHQTSGTSHGATPDDASPDGAPAPLRWLDTKESWAWFKKCWSVIYAGAGVGSEDRVFFPFSFGPFVGFWAAFETAVEMGAFCLPAGGMTTLARIRHLLDHSATVICCTPTYALRMAEVADEAGIELGGSPVRALIVAGEPGGSIPATRSRIESAWGARVLDHTGMTEIGSCSFECAERPGGVHVIETEFIPEVVDDAGRPVALGEVGELVLTNLGRWGSPLIRYRTGDQVRMIRERCACGRWFAWLDGGILGRTDDMVVIRGNNVFPSAVEGFLRAFDEVGEFRVEVDRRAALPELRLIVESRAQVDSAGLTEKVAAAFRNQFHFKAAVVAVAHGSLPRFEMKARRFVTLLSETP